MANTTLCPRCGAPIPWDGKSPTVNCPYCHVVTAAPIGASPRGPHPAMVSPKSGGAAIGCIIAAVAVALLVVGGGAAAVFALRGAAPAALSVVATSVGPIPTIAHSVVAAAPTALRVFGEKGNGAGQLTDARSVAVDMDENVYVGDYDSLRVQKFDATGKFVWIISVPKEEFAGNKTIWGMAVDSKNVLWVARTGALLKYATADGKALGAINGNYDSLYFKWIAIDPVGNIATTHNTGPDSDLLLLNPSGKLKKRVKGKDPAGLAVDGAGNIYMTMPYDGIIEVLEPTGEVKSRFGSKQDKHTNHPSAIAVDGKGHVFVVTGEGLDVFDQGGSFIKTIDTGLHASLRDICVSSKNHLVVLGGDKVAVLDIGGL